MHFCHKISCFYCCPPRGQNNLLLKRLCSEQFIIFISYYPSMDGTEREMNLRTYKHHSSLTINIETTRSIVKNMSMGNISYCIQAFTNIKSSSFLQYLIFCKNVARQAITSKELSSYRMKTLTSSVCCFQILSTFKCKLRYQIV